MAKDKRRAGLAAEIARRQTAAKESTARPDDWFEREHRAAMAEHSYLSVGPRIRMGMIPTKILDRWTEAVEGGKMSSTRNFLLASLTIEAARSLAGEQPTTAREAGFPKKIDTYLGKASQALESIARDTEADDALKLQAQLLRTSLNFYGGLLKLEPGAILMPKRDEFVRRQNEIARSVLTGMKGEHGLSDDVMQALTAEIVLINGKYIAVPALARFSSPKFDREHATQLYVIDLDMGEEAATEEGAPVARRYGETQIQVSSVRKPGVVCLDPKDLLHDESPAAVDHGYGTLTAFADWRSLLPKPMGGAVRRVAQADAPVIRDGMLDAQVAKIKGHNNKVLTRVRDIIIEQLPGVVKREVVHSRPFSTPLDIVKWYANLSAFHSFEPYLPRLEQAVSILDKADRDNTLDQIDRFALAWMHTELGMVEAREGKTGPRVEDHFRRAEILFDTFSKNAKFGNDLVSSFQGQFDKIAVPLYRAIALRDPSLQTIIGTYSHLLAKLALEMRDASETIGDQSRSQIGQMIDEATTILLLTTEEESSYLPIPSSLRQSVDDIGLVVWVKTAENILGDERFTPEYFGFVTVPEISDDKESPYIFHVSDEGLLDDVISQMNGDPDQDGRDDRIMSAREEVKSIVDTVIEE